MNSPPLPDLYRFDFKALTDEDLVTAWKTHQRLREHLNTEDVITVVMLAIKYGDLDGVPLLKFADVILAFYNALADELEGMV